MKRGMSAGERAYKDMNAVMKRKDGFGKYKNAQKLEKMQISGLTDRECCDIVIKVVCDHAEDSRC